MSGSDVPGSTEGTTTPRADSAPGAPVCRNCGTVLAYGVIVVVDGVFVCPSCGTPVFANSKPNATSNSKPNADASSNPKSKGFAVRLAVFLGPCAWLYTWRKDWWKILFLLVVVPVLARGWILFPWTEATGPGDFIFRFLLFWLGLPFAVVLGEDSVRFLVSWIAVGWLSPLILALARSTTFYEQYPNYKG